jgi:hypothetical protein
MSLYTKGPWARFTFDTQQMRDVCDSMVGDTATLFKVSAFYAKTRLLSEGVGSTVGINPPGIPRADEQEPFERPKLEKYYHPAVQEAVKQGSETPWIIIADKEEIDLTVDLRFGFKDTEFYLNPEKTQIGFWLVCHENTDLDDKNSLREQLAADLSHRPFKSMTKADQKAVNEELVNKMKTYAKRTQAPVMIDIERGELWIGTSSKKVIEALIAFFAPGVVLNRLSLSFGGESSWLKAFLGEIVAKDLYKLEHEDMVKKALEADPEKVDGDDEPTDASWEQGGPAVIHPTDVPDGKEKPEYPSGSNCIAVLNMDQAGFIVNLDAPAVLAPTADSSATIGVKEFVDALLVLHAMPGSHVGSGIVTFKDRGGSHCTLELSAAMVTGPTLTWRALAPSIKLQDLPNYEEQSGMLYQWRLWFDTLRYCEKMVVEAICHTLGLDPTAINNGIVATSGQTVETAIEVECTTRESVAGSAADIRKLGKKIKDYFAAAGVTSVTVATGAKSTQINLED